MPNSMTGFARVDATLPMGVISWELASVNNRFMDVQVRSPEYLRPHQASYREQIKQAMQRGKIEAKCFFQRDSDTPTERVSANRLAALQGQQTQIMAALPEAASPTWLDVLRWPGLLEQETLDVDALHEAAGTLLTRAIEALTQARADEGKRLSEVLQDKLTQLAAHLAQVRTHLPSLVEQKRGQLKDRLETLGTEVEPVRFEQEVVYLLQRMDVAEELDRLDVHIDKTKSILSAGGVMGRQLDFLMQEFNREVNTLSSKIQDQQVTDACIASKVLVEQMREQVQNLE